MKYTIMHAYMLVPLYVLSHALLSPNLSWRDIQYLIAYTSDPSPFQSASGWTTNGAGLLVSHQFGFGAIDAEAMVTRAQYWTSVPQQRTCTVKPSSNGNKFVVEYNWHGHLPLHV